MPKPSQFQTAIDLQRTLKNNKIFLLSIALTGLILNPFSLAQASDNVVKLKYMPGLVPAGRFTDVSINGIGGDQTAAQVYAKLKAIEALGTMDYLVPDAPSIRIEVTFDGKTLSSANAYDVRKPAAFAEYDRLWHEAYSIARRALDEDLKVTQE